MTGFTKKIIKEAINPLSGLSKTKEILGNIGNNISDTATFIINRRRLALQSGPKTKEELKVRYKNGQVSAALTLAAMLWAIYCTIASETIPGLILHSSSLTIIIGYYFVLCRTLYAARAMYEKWGEDAPLVSWSNYLNAISENIKNAFPVSLDSGRAI